VSITGLFFHYQDGDRLRDFPQALEGILSQDNVFFYDAFYPLKPPSSFDLEPIPVEVVGQVHASDMIERIRKSAAFEGALFSASGTVAAAIRIWKGEIANAFAQRFAIIDTDAHHGDGTWEIFSDDPDVLYLCFCSGGYLEKDNKVNVQVPWRVGDEEYLRLVSRNLLQRAEDFQPEAIFWNWGYDGTQGEYGDIGLTPDSHVLLAREIKRAADQLCHGRLIVVLCGGSRRDLARSIIPKVIRVLAG